MDHHHHVDGEESSEVGRQLRFLATGFSTVRFCAFFFGVTTGLGLLSDEGALRLSPAARACPISSHVKASTWAKSVAAETDGAIITELSEDANEAVIAIDSQNSEPTRA